MASFSKLRFSCCNRETFGIALTCLLRFGTAASFSFDSIFSSRSTRKLRTNFSNSSSLIASENGVMVRYDSS
uniref:Putative secreted peptide n=1 Tax=Anopheles braziliensis TaxID=58242 RepID=A0A2M3ZVP5_9DIPT